LYKNARILFLLLSFLPGMVFSQSASSRGQISGWMTGGEDNFPVSQLGYRYIPELTIEMPLPEGLYLDSQIALNSYGSSDLENGEDPVNEADIKPYRIWARLSGSRFELRAGLQKINFGSAALFRPVKWFDHVDPRDPLELTDGVYGVLGRYYFQNNTNIWLWGLYGNENIKGWETSPTAEKTLEPGGRIQVPFAIGEAALSFHHRKADYTGSQILSAMSDDENVIENSYAFDIKLDAVTGMWLEAAVTHRDSDIDFMKYSTMWTIGTDYTFNTGNGLNILCEYFSASGGENVFDDTSSIRSQFIGAQGVYPFSLLDRVSVIYYYDITNNDNYLTLQWQRVYDSWTINISGFLNPDAGGSISGSSGITAAGNGFQIMTIYNY